MSSAGHLVWLLLLSEAPAPTGLIADFAGRYQATRDGHSCEIRVDANVYRERCGEGPESGGLVTVTRNAVFLDWSVALESWTLHEALSYHRDYRLAADMYRNQTLQEQGFVPIVAEPKQTVDLAVRNRVLRVVRKNEPTMSGSVFIPARTRGRQYLVPYGARLPFCVAVLGHDDPKAREDLKGFYSTKAATKDWRLKPADLCERDWPIDLPESEPRVESEVP
jgi:hypothetical protein